VSANLAEKIQLGLDELAVIKGMISPLIARTGEPELPVIETAAACTMLHSFYTEIEKILKLIALDIDKKIPSSELFESLTNFNVFFAWVPPIPTNRPMTVPSFESSLGY
jgi:hypothetical protein